MPFLHTPAGRVSDFDPEKTEPEDILRICAMAGANIAALAGQGAELSGLAASARRIRHEVQSVATGVQRPEIRACRRSHGHADRLLSRLNRLEREAGQLFFAGREALPPAHPLRRAGDLHEEYRRLREAGRIFGIIQV